MGKPLKYKTLQELQIAIDEYFSFCDNRIQHVYSSKADGVIEVIDPEPYTMSGLAYSVGLSRQALNEYAHKDDYGDAIKKARMRVEMDVERRLMEGKGTIGAIFNLKNNFGWKDAKQLLGKDDGPIEQNVSITYLPDQLDRDFYKK